MRQDATQEHESATLRLACAERFGVRWLATALQRIKSGGKPPHSKAFGLFSGQIQARAIEPGCAHLRMNVLRLSTSFGVVLIWAGSYEMNEHEGAL